MIRTATVWCLIVAAVSGGAILYQKLHSRVRFDNFGIVEPGRIYRSGQLAPDQIETFITTYRIRTIIDTHIPEMSLKDIETVQRICMRHNVNIIPIIMPGDGRGGYEQYDQALNILREPANLPVLVCCARGTHRTGALIASYRVLIQNWPVDKAMSEMEQFRFNPREGAARGEHPLVAHLRTYLHSRSSNSTAEATGTVRAATSR